VQENSVSKQLTEIKNFAYGIIIIVGSVPITTNIMSSNSTRYNII